MIRWLRKQRIGWRYGKAIIRGEVKFLGQCDCGCGYWVVEFDGKKQLVSEPIYDKGRYQQAVLHG